MTTLPPLTESAPEIVPLVTWTESAYRALGALCAHRGAHYEVVAHLEEQARDALRELAFQASPNDDDVAEKIYRRLCGGADLSPV